MSLTRAVREDRLGACCLIFLLAVFLAALLAPWIAPHDPLAVDVRQKFAPWSAEHWLGTDHLGRDVLSRLLHGARATLGFSLLTTILTLLAGALPGLLAGALRGRAEAALMRLCDALLAFPSEALILAAVGMLGPSPENAALACIVAKWPWYARMLCVVARQYADTNAVRFARVMGRGRVRRLPVVEDGRVVGMLSLGDIARASSVEAAAALAEISSPVLRLSAED